MPVPAERVTAPIISPVSALKLAVVEVAPASFTSAVAPASDDSATPLLGSTDKHAVPAELHPSVHALVPVTGQLSVPLAHVHAVDTSPRFASVSPALAHAPATHDCDGGH
jgi:hypothetical protein